MEDHTEIYDLLVLVDATYSMSDYINSLQASLPKIIALSSLTDCFSRVGLLAYRDYCDTKLLEWSGWLCHDENQKDEDKPDLAAKAKSLEPMGGGDYPEAVKTGLAKAYDLMRPEATTIIFLYTDAPPHSLNNGYMNEEWSNLGKEKKALADPNSYGGYGPKFADWVSASDILHHGEKKAQVFCVMEPSIAWQYVGFYNYLSTITRGACIYLKDSKPHSIAEVTVQMLLAWMGVEKAGTSTSAALPASLSRYLDVKSIRTAKNENDIAADMFFAATLNEKDAKVKIRENITEVTLTQDILKKYLPKKKTPVQDFAKRYAGDEKYKVIAVQELKKIIAADVSAVSLNPVFGSLWRVVCNDRDNPARESLITEFGLNVERIRDPDEKARMKTWLEESYDYSAEVAHAIQEVPEEERFPCVFLDPTLSFVKGFEAKDKNDEDEEEDADDRPITEFRRDELLEIGRSCDYKILRRLGRILTRLTFVKSEKELPAHIASTTNEDYPKIPMVLTQEKYGQKFWKMLLHLVVPGTMLAARPAALLAALSIRLGVQPLIESAELELLKWKNRWNNLDVPETWNLNCLSLLLDADKAYRRKTEGADSKILSKSSGLLKNDDRKLFEKLVEYKMLEVNLQTTLTAKVGWTPNKSSVPMGPLVTCRSCQFPRSVTVMSKGRKCGLCVANDYADDKEKEAYIQQKVSTSDNEETSATWVECSARECRAQYVIYNTDKLNVRAKCHYCREQLGHAPCVQCSKCWNRVIWPAEYRPSGFDEKSFICYACSNGRQTIVEKETTAKELSTENTASWLLKNDSSSLTEPFTNRTLYHVIKTVSPEQFSTKIHLFPEASPELKLSGKALHNSSNLTSRLKSLVSIHHRPKVPCSLCFSSFPPTALLLACGRSGCTQRLCRSCLKGWYGLNGAGRIINTAALFCPFCRRAPSAKTLANYGMGIHAVSGLKTAVEERGNWVFAWCADCGTAKRFCERVCARGVVGDDVRDWACEECEIMAEEMERADDEAIENLLEEQAQDDADIAADALAGMRIGGNRGQRGVRAGYTRTKSRTRLETHKKCPGCGILVQKTYGCNHMECPVRKCGIHWCWACSWVEDRDSDIYEHIESVHGGLYGDDDDEEEDNAVELNDYHDLG